MESSWQGLPRDHPSSDYGPRAACAAACGSCQSRESQSCRPPGASARCCRKWFRRSLHCPCGLTPPTGTLHRSDQPWSYAFSLRRCRNESGLCLGSGLPSHIRACITFSNFRGCAQVAFLGQASRLRLSASGFDVAAPRTDSLELRCPFLKPEAESLKPTLQPAPSLPQIIKSHLLIHQLLPRRQPLRNVPEKQISQGLAIFVRTDQHRLSPDSDGLRGIVHSRLEVANLIDQVHGQRFLPGPPSAVGNCLNVGSFLVSPIRDRFHELAVHVVDQRLHVRPFFRSH